MPFALDAFRSAYGESPEILREICEIYREQAPQRIETIRRGIDASDFPEISKAAHSLANTSGTLKYDDAVVVARELEEAARNADLAACRASAIRLIPMIEEMLSAVVAQVDSSPGAGDA